MKVMCRLGRHEWKRKRNEDGQPYKECARCGTCRELGGGGNSAGIVSAGGV